MTENLSLIEGASQQLDAFLAQYGSGVLGSQQPPPDLTLLMQTVDGVRRVLQNSPPPADLDTASRKTIDDYVGRLKRVESVLEKLRPQLEGRREEIYSRIAKVRAALDWSNSLNQTR